MPRPNDSPDVAASKTLAYILRHGAEKEMLDMRKDGYLKLNDVLARPKMRGIDTEMVLRLVAENAKQRFEVFYGYDPSSPKPKVKKGQGKGQGKGKGKGKAKNGDAAATPSGTVPMNGRNINGQAKLDEEGSTGPGDQGTVPQVRREEKAATSTPATAAGGPSDLSSPPDVSSGGAPRTEVDAAQLDDLSTSLASTAISSELPLVALPQPGTDEAPTPDAESTTASPAPNEAQAHAGEWFIRATQGHSIKLESVSHLVPVGDDEEGLARAGECVHGTRWELWDTLIKSGLSRMARTHIHLAPALSNHPILPRPNSTLRIYLSVPKLLRAGIPLYTSLNGVVLTPGDPQGYVSREYWRLAERKVQGEWVVVLRDGEVLEDPRGV